MYSHLLDLFLVLGSYIDEDVLWFGWFLLGPAPGVDGRPSKHTIYNTLVRVNIDHLGRGDLVITSAVANDIDQPIVADVIDIPRDLVSMSFYHNPVVLPGIDHSYSGTIGVCNELIDIGLEVFHP